MSFHDTRWVVSTCRSAASWPFPQWGVQWRSSLSETLAERLAQPQFGASREALAGLRYVNVDLKSISSSAKAHFVSLCLGLSFPR